MPKPVTPLLAADILITLTDRSERPFVLIERANPPFGWALPGGFVDIGETVAQAAVREALEETGLEIKLTALLGIYSDPRRDPRGHTVTAVYLAEANGIPIASDDAKHCGVFTFDNLPSSLAFDHDRVLADSKNYFTSGHVAPLYR